MNFQDINPDNYDYVGIMNSQFIFKHRMPGIGESSLYSLMTVAMRDSQFTQAVRDMLTKQELYFKLKTTDTLINAKKAEELVKRYLNQFDKTR